MVDNGDIMVDCLPRIFLALKAPVSETCQGGGGLATGSQAISSVYGQPLGSDETLRDDNRATSASWPVRGDDACYQRQDPERRRSSGKGTGERFCWRC